MFHVFLKNLENSSIFGSEVFTPISIAQKITSLPNIKEYVEANNPDLRQTHFVQYVATRWFSINDSFQSAVDLAPFSVVCEDKKDSKDLTLGNRIHPSLSESDRTTTFSFFGYSTLYHELFINFIINPNT